MLEEIVTGTVTDVVVVVTAVDGNVVLERGPSIPVVVLANGGVVVCDSVVSLSGVSDPVDNMVCGFVPPTVFSLVKSFVTSPKPVTVSL